MASLATLLLPISETPTLKSKTISWRLVNFSSLSENMSFSGHWSQFILPRTLQISSTRSTAVQSSSQTQISPGTESTQPSDIPLISSSEAIKRLREFRESYESKQQYLAMYSSIFGGITTDPAAMVIPLDDHMVHRGHGVFDTAAIFDGSVFTYPHHFVVFDFSNSCISDIDVGTKYVYELDQHLDRFLHSASMARITPPFDKQTIRKILIKTISTSKCREGSLRYWLSSGPGDFLLSPSSCHCPTLYAIIMCGTTQSHSQRGIKVITSSIPIKSPQFAVMKSVNYLPNVLTKMEAEDREAYAGIWLDERGYVAEGPNMNVAFVTEARELLMPRFDRILSGCTAKRVLELAKGLVGEGMIEGVRVDDVAVEEGRKAQEMMLIGSGTYVRPVVQWDDQVIGDGEEFGNEGPVTLALLKLLLEDMRSGPDTVRIPIPY
ncbi:D-alanine aminotransferase [Striga asiatica]|uniref:D-alanine aminotransferase n=1 Tax=Striga asiatica TaxID=4170 RepID=A0A5A7PLN3_STRAF|nr:D-alanine aminotransferase [Striga asiatica]